LDEKQLRLKAHHERRAQRRDSSYPEFSGAELLLEFALWIYERVPIGVGRVRIASIVGLIWSRTAFLGATIAPFAKTPPRSRDTTLKPESDAESRCPGWVIDMNPVMRRATDQIDVLDHPRGTDLRIGADARLCGRRRRQRQADRNDY
jgi:hypothetical protein